MSEGIGRTLTLPPLNRPCDPDFGDCSTAAAAAGPVAEAPAPAMPSAAPQTTETSSPPPSEVSAGAVDIMEPSTPEGDEKKTKSKEPGRFSVGAGFRFSAMQPPKGAELNVGYQWAQEAGEYRRPASFRISGYAYYAGSRDKSNQPSEYNDGVYSATSDINTKSSQWGAGGGVEGEYQRVLFASKNNAFRLSWGLGIGIGVAAEGSSKHDSERATLTDIAKDVTVEGGYDDKSTSKITSFNLHGVTAIHIGLGKKQRFSIDARFLPGVSLGGTMRSTRTQSEVGGQTVQTTEATRPKARPSFGDIVIGASFRF